MIELPSDTDEPLIVIAEFAKLTFVMTPVLVKELKAIAPPSDNERPCASRKLKSWNVDEAEVDVATRTAEPIIGASIPPLYVVVPVVVNRFKPESVFASESSVDEAKVQVDVENEYRRPEFVTPTAPAVRPPTVRLPLNNPLPATLNCCDGVEVPIPTLPFESMINAVEVEFEVEDATANSGITDDWLEVPFTESIAQGELEPTPTNPRALTVETVAPALVWNCIRSAVCPLLPRIATPRESP
jgi:hypothetical protein